MTKKKLVYTENGLALKELMEVHGWSRPKVAAILTKLKLPTSCKAVDTWLAPVSAKCHRSMPDKKLATVESYAGRVKR